MNAHFIIRPTQLAEELGVSTTTLWRWRQQGIIPQPLSLGPRLVGWDRSVINQWLESQKKMEISL
ncbi:helix-turn-helix transcriptional regulator [Aeromonas media]|uniref:helix-turn-helix transcriptional regulator n=1 Tax=Aeromonas media TaxID=651 RepID=UPI00370C17B6